MIIKKHVYYLIRYFLICFLLPLSTLSKIVGAKLIISEQSINITGKEVKGLTINKSIPGPTLKARVGDILRVAVKNDLSTETSIHWHGVLVPNEMDGVPYVTTPPIKPGEVFQYEFPIKHSGTYWYHAHSALQEQRGVYGSLVFSPRNEDKNTDEDHVLVLSDWTNEKPEHVLAHLKKDSDYYALKKDAVQSWTNVLKNGSKAIKIRVKSALHRLGPMDLSDIGYDAFLINGKRTSSLTRAKPGTSIKLRLINAGASTSFIVEYAGGPLTVIEADGVKITPFTAKRIRIAMAETYDILVTIPKHNTYELRASAEDGTGFATSLIGQGPLIQAPLLPKPNLALMDMMNMDHGSMNTMHPTPDGETMGHSAHQGMAMPMDMDMGMDMPMSTSSPKAPKELPDVDFLVDYKNLKSPTVTTLPKKNPTRTIPLKLTGSMERYVWSINNKPMYAADKINIKKGENIKFQLINETMMYHPIHLHGHFFRVLNGQGDYSPLKHTVNVPPFQTVEIEFEANLEKDWMFHCHNLYHMKLGMGGIVHYEGSEPDHRLMDHSSHHAAEHGNQWFGAAILEGFSNFAFVALKATRHNDNLIVEGRSNYKRDYETEVIYKRYFSQFFGLYLGGEFEKEKRTPSNTGIAGFVYTLPFLIKADLRLNTKGRIRFALSNEHQLTDRVTFEWKCNTDQELTLAAYYALSKKIALTCNYDNRENFGFGLRLML